MQKTTLFFCLLLAACGGEQADFTSPTFKASSSIYRDIIAVQLNAPPEVHESIRMAEVDLNADGQPEYIGHSQDDYFCGSLGCGYFLLVQIENAWRIANYIVAHSLEIGTQTENDYQVLRMNNQVIWTWTGEAYTARPAQ